MGSTPLAPGSVFAGDFQVVRLLADGGMGSVYVAEQLSTGKRRALKVMHPRMLRDPTLRERFTQEARLGAKIASDHVVEVVGAGVDAATGIPWMAMELLEGRDLSVALVEHGPYALAEAQGILRQAGHALSRAHHLGIVHRDLKPENLFLADTRREGVGATVKLLDFGIAKVMQETRATGATIGGLGTPLWMAPEQTHGGLITPATDVWALGLIGFALLAGRSYWKSATGDAALPAVLMEMFAAAMPTASERVAELGLPTRLPAGFDAWFAQCVARDAHARFVSAEPCIAAFLGLGAASAVALRPRVAPTAVGLASVPGRPPSASPPPLRPSAPRRGWWSAMVAAVMLVPILGFGAWLALHPASSALPVPAAPSSGRASLAENQLAHDALAPTSAAPTPPAPNLAPPPDPTLSPASLRPRAPAVRRPEMAPRRPPPRARAADLPVEPAYSTVREPLPAPAPSYPSPPAVTAPEAPNPQAPTVAPPPPVEAPVAPAPAAPPGRGSVCAPCTQGMTERCNGCDDNCNGMVDEGC